MRRFGFWLGIAILGLFMLATLAGFFVKHGWAGLITVSLFVGAVWLVIVCADEN